MKTIAFLFVLVATSAAADLTVTFDYEFTNTQICKTGVTTDCLDHFEIGTLKNSVFSLLGNVPLPANASGKMTGITATMPIPKFGSTTVSAIAVAFDSTGARLTSDPAAATVTLVIVPRPPTNFGVN